MENLEHDFFVAVTASDRLRLRRIYRQDAGPAVLLVHGAMANGRIFYSNTGKGLAHYLARAGYDVFVLDLRGRGGSTPIIDKRARHGQTESIRDDIPAAHRAIRALKGDAPIHWMAHSWGGVLMHSALLRDPDLIPDVASCVYFASKRTVRVKNLQRRLKVDFFWNGVAHLITHVVGYLPSRAMGLGPDNETRLSHAHSSRWVRDDRWVDPVDGFDYAAAATRLALPPTLYFAAWDDPCLGHRDDVRRFRDEAGQHVSRLHLLGRCTGHRQDYDHASLLTHPDAVDDHFPLVLRWLAGDFAAVPENI
ncbi:MAG: alpha/beta fold hydrolase [Paludibacterium sp.]|uniref:alpha/beta hydrolase family protein n=1 Tax=Paludibacterium sp. TaxID=1917523 RepID=UPI0025DA68FA|nr:alpha/beta fold hydrolase [Paludibacterium sp.]MBV8047749.1 alpha/beta fold hydrolase [Paludibacterium sp.]MBV8648081.1 alpha/beta fold hydrolase [Paludibacterium sp.]